MYPLCFEPLNFHFKTFLDFLLLVETENLCGLYIIMCCVSAVTLVYMILRFVLYIERQKSCHLAVKTTFDLWTCDDLKSTRAALCFVLRFFFSCFCIFHGILLSFDDGALIINPVCVENYLTRFFFCKKIYVNMLFSCFFYLHFTSF